MRFFWANLTRPQLYTRAFILKLFGSDDIAVCIALVCSGLQFDCSHQPTGKTNKKKKAITQVFNGLGVAVVYYGEGRHFENVSAEYKAIWLKVTSKQPRQFNCRNMSLS
jgi:hypothetical protein